MSSQIITPQTEAAILAGLIERSQADLSGAAEYLLSIRFEDPDITRMNELSELRLSFNSSAKREVGQTGPFEFS
jgi:hypothetical protein